MNDSRFANDEAFLSQEKLTETLAEWVSLSSSECAQFLHL